MEWSEMYANYYPDEDEDPFIDSGWACDVDLIPYCVSLLKTCHHLTERLVAKTMEKSTYEMKSCEQMMEIIETARSISPRVDDVVKYMYPPLDSHQIESRSTALYMSVNHLVQITKTLCGNGESLAWAEQLLESMDQEIQAMRQIISNIAQLSSADSVSNTSISTRSSQSTEPMLEPKAELLA